MDQNEVHLTPRELAARLKRSEPTLRKWRHLGKGPRYIGGGGTGMHVLYPIAAVVEWENGLVGTKAQG